jgi:predicted transport protein
MTDTSSQVNHYLGDKNEAAAALFLEFRDACLNAGDGVTEKVSKTMVAWRGKRTFATAYVKGRYLECSIDLLHEVEHEHLKSSFNTTKKVVTNRFTFEPTEKIDARLRSWLHEAFADVAPGTR